MVVNNPNMVAPKAQPASARPAVETGVSAPRVAAPVRTAPVVQESAPVYHPTRLVAETATADKTATATATPENPHVSAQQGGQSGTSNASQSAHVQVTPRGVYQQTTTTQNGQTTQSSSFTPAQNASQGATTNPNVGRTNPYVNTQLPQNAQNSEKNTTIQVDHSKLDNDIAQAKKDGVQVTHTADDQPIVVHSQNEAHDYEDQASQEYNNEDQAIIKADNIQKAYNADKTLINTENSAIQNAANEAKQAGVLIDSSKPRQYDFSNHTPSLQDAQVLHNAITAGANSTIGSIKQAEAKLKQEVDQAWQSMGQSISGNARADGKLIDSGIKSTQGVSAADAPVYLHDGNNKPHLVYCVQPYGVGPGVDGTSDHVTLQTGIQGNGDQQRTLAGIMYLGFGGPGNQGYSQLETHLALSYYLYHNDLAHIKNWEQKHEGVTDQIADQWLHYGKVQQLINAAENWDKDGSIMYRLYSGHADNTTNGNSQDADSDKNVSGSRGSQLLVAANFTKRPVLHIKVPTMEASVPTVKADYHYMSAKLGNTDTQTSGSAMPNININVSANANAKAKAKANANANVNVNANAKGQGNANANGSSKGCGMSRGHGCGAGAATGTGAGCGMGSGYGNYGMVESVPACGGYGSVDTGYGAGVASPLVAMGAVSGQGAVSMPVAAAGNGAGVGNGAGEGNGVAMPATGQKNGSVLADLAAVAAAVIGGSMLIKKRNA